MKSTFFVAPAGGRVRRRTPPRPVSAAYDSPGCHFCQQKTDMFAFFVSFRRPERVGIKIEVLRAIRNGGTTEIN